MTGRGFLRALLLAFTLLVVFSPAVRHLILTSAGLIIGIVAGMLLGAVIFAMSSVRR